MSPRRTRRQRLLSFDDPRNVDEDSSIQWNDMVPDGGLTPVARLEKKELGKRTRRAVNELPDPLRLVVLLVYFQGLKYREAASALSIPVGTVKSRMHTAIAKLNEQRQLAEEHVS